MWQDGVNWIRDTGTFSYAKMINLDYHFLVSKGHILASLMARIKCQKYPDFVWFMDKHQSSHTLKKVKQVVNTLV